MSVKTICATPLCLYQCSPSKINRISKTDWQITASEDISTKLSPSELACVFQYISSNLGQKISLSNLADAVNRSPYHFTRLFKQATGFTPYQYVIQCRIERAKQLLRETDLAIALIAQQVGFSSHGSFTKAFRKHTNLSPKVYRRQR
ncbi:MAG: helix-turn-helix domain-containing protein [Cyanophyceae cyanobacterium]